MSYGECPDRVRKQTRDHGAKTSISTEVAKGLAYPQAARVVLQTRRGTI